MLVERGYKIVNLLEALKHQVASSKNPLQQHHKGNQADADLKSVDGHDDQPHDGTTNANDQATGSETLANTDRGLSLALFEKLTELEQKIQDQKNKALYVYNCYELLYFKVLSWLASYEYRKDRIGQNRLCFLLLDQIRWFSRIRFS